MPSVSDFRLGDISSQHQQDRSAQAVVWGGTRKECFEKFVELMIRNSR